MRFYSIAIGLGTLVLGGATLVGPNPAAPATPSIAAVERALADLDVTRPVRLTAGCIGCPLCSGTTPGGPHHLSAPGSGSLQVYPGSDHGLECIPQNCMECHYFDFECGSEGAEEAFSAEEQETLWRIATGQDALAVLGALEQYPKALKLNLEHGSLQLYNCLGEIAASIPILPGRIAEFQAALAR